ncbi:MAG: hypothetical protein Q9222_005977 [Ikaeria aurantiellina]
MVRVALAGGTGGFGHTLLDEFARGNEHTVFLLSRKSELPFKTPANVQCLTTNYDNVDDLVDLLEKNQVHTVIFTMNPPTPEVHAAQNNLIRAAAQTAVVKRHLPLSWKKFKQQSIAVLEEHPNIEYTKVYNGHFMDYFGMPHCSSYMLPEVPYINIAARKAAIPGSGDEKITLTYTKDVAKFVRRLVESDYKWSAHSLVVGDVVTLNEVLQIAEEVRGTKFEVVRDSLEDLRAGRISEIPAYLTLYETIPKDFLLEMMAGLGVAMVTGIFDLNGKLLKDEYPEIVTTKTRDFITTHWAGTGQ